MHASCVVSNADPRRTFLSLLRADELPEAFRRDVAGIKMNGPCAKVNFVLSEEPRVPGMPASHSAAERSLFTLAPSLAEAEDSYNRAMRGGIPEQLWVDCVVASNVDPSLVQDGRHVMTCFVQFLPYRLRESDWPAERERLGDRVTEIIGHYAPNVPGAVVARRVLTPFDLEQTFGITEGNIFHGDINLGQLSFMRPVPGWSKSTGRRPVPVWCRHASRRRRDRCPGVQRGKTDTRGPALSVNATSTRARRTP